MLPMCQLKVKVTVKGQIFNKQILHIMLCPLYKPYTVKPRLSGHLRSRENFRINEVSVYMNRDLFAHVLYVEC